MSYSPCIQCKKLNRVSSEPYRGVAVCGSCKTELPFRAGINELGMPELLLLIEKSPIPVVTDFWAPWCGPCRAFAPTFEQAAKELENKVVFAKVNTEANPNASQAYGIRGIPLFIAFQQGKEKGRQSGALPLAPFMSWVKSFL